MDKLTRPQKIGLSKLLATSGAVVIPRGSSDNMKFNSLERKGIAHHRNSDADNVRWELKIERSEAIRRLNAR